MDDLVTGLQSTTEYSFRVRPVGVFLGAEITGVDLSRPLTAGQQAELSQAHAEFGVLVFPGQQISSDDLRRFGGYFGELTVHPFSSSTEDNPELIVYDNKENNPPAPTDIWHTDETFREEPPMGTMLCCKEIPAVGGDTNFCSMTALYDGLSDRWQAFLSGLEAVHDFLPFKDLFADTPEGRAKLNEYEEIYRPAVHPVVRVHPVTGRKAIYVNPQFTTHIKGMEADESRVVLEMLYRKTLRHEYHYRHRWQSDMVVFWDNRSTQHSALHDYYPNRRLMERVTVKGGRPVGDAPPPDESETRRYLMPPISAFRDSRQKRQHEL